MALKFNGLRPPAAAVVIVVASLAPVAAQNAAPASDSARIRVITVAQRGGPPTGPTQVVVEHDQTLATHTIYRPANLGSSTHGVLVWGEGGCAKNGLTFPEFLTEIASYGFVVIADGPVRHLQRRELAHSVEVAEVASPSTVLEA